MGKLKMGIKSSAGATKRIFMDGNFLVKIVMTLMAIGAIAGFFSILLDLLKIASLVVLIYGIYFVIKKFKLWPVKI